MPVIPFARLAALVSLAAGVLSVWVHLETRLAEINVEIVNLKQDIAVHRAANQRDHETLHNDLVAGTREIVQKIDEIQIYLRRRP